MPLHARQHRLGCVKRRRSDAFPPSLVMAFQISSIWVLAWAVRRAILAPMTQKYPFTRTHLILTALGVLLLAILTVVQLAHRWLFEADWLMWPEWAQLLLLVGGMAAFAMGLGRVRGLRDDRASAAVSSLTPSSLVMVGVPLLLTVFAFLVRVGPPQTEIRVLVDELQTVTQVLMVWDSPPDSLLAKMYSNLMPYPLVFGYLTERSAALFGTTLFGLRFPSMVAGSLTVLATYFLALTLTDDRITATAAGLMLAALPVAVHFGRLALISNFDPLFGTAALLFIARGWKHGHPLDWVLGGMALGATYWFFEGGRLFFTALVVLWLAWSAIFDLRGMGSRWQGLLVLVAGYAVTAGPVQITWALADEISSRMDASALSGDVLLDIFTSGLQDPAFQNYMAGFARAYAVMVAIPESSPFYGGDAPLLLWFVAPFGVLGLVACLRYFVNYRILPVMWVLAVPAANALILANTHAAPRYIVGFPAMSLLTGYGISIVSRWAGPYRRAVGVGLAALLVIGQGVYYYGEHLPAFNAAIRHQTDVEDAMLRAAELPPAATVYLVHQEPWRDRLYPITFVRYLTHEQSAPVTVYTTGEFIPLLAEPLPEMPVFFIEQSDSASLDALYEHFGELNCQLSPYPVPQPTQFLMCQP